MKIRGESRDIVPDTAFRLLLPRDSEKQPIYSHFAASRLTLYGLNERAVGVLPGICFRWR